MSDLFSTNTKKTKPSDTYTASDIQVLEGLEPVRHRPGMYIGGTDLRALHHLVAELVDNAMDEVVAGFATKVEVHLFEGNRITVSDNGRGIPVDQHPKFPDRSALEVILTTLHSGGKFGGKVYETSGGLHGVGLSVVNALASTLEIEVAREQKLWKQTYERGAPITKLESNEAAGRRKGTRITFVPDTDIFGSELKFDPSLLYKMLRSKAYLYRGVEIFWSCSDAALLGKTPQEEKFHFPGGVEDFLNATVADRSTITTQHFSGTADLPDRAGRIEWAITWPLDEEGFTSTYCNTIPTPQGGTHEQGMRQALLKGLRAYGELTGNKKAAQITAEDFLAAAVMIVSVFIKNPQFQGQTKEKLVNTEVARLIEPIIKDHFDHYLVARPDEAGALMDYATSKMEERLSRKLTKETARASATRKLRLPGKLIDCRQSDPVGTEIFLVEGDSAGGTAKQARDPVTQAVLPLRGKILNVASATVDKLLANQEVSDLGLALGCGLGKNFDINKLRYERIIIMTDADIDGAHIASLLMTFFYKEMRPIVEAGRLYLSQPPLYRITDGKNVTYALNDDQKEVVLKKLGGKKVEISRFKGLGEMPARALKETTMDKSRRSLLRVVIHPEDDTQIVDRLMGKKAEERFIFIQENAKFATNLDI